MNVIKNFKYAYFSCIVAVVKDDRCFVFLNTDAHYDNQQLLCLLTRVTKNNYLNQYSIVTHHNFYAFQPHRLCSISLPHGVITMHYSQKPIYKLTSTRTLMLQKLVLSHVTTKIKEKRFAAGNTKPSDRKSITSHI